MNYWNGFLWKKEKRVRKETAEKKNWQDRLHAVIDELNKEDNRRLYFECILFCKPYAD